MIKRVVIRVWLYLERVGSAGSQFLGALLCLTDNPNESISGRSYERQWFARHIINAPFKLIGQKDHCKESYEADVDWARETIVKDQIRKLKDLKKP